MSEIINGMTLTETEIDGRQTVIVESPSGNTYNVSYHGIRDGGHVVNTWACDCQAGQHGRDCKHVAAVIAWASTQDFNGEDS